MKCEDLQIRVDKAKIKAFEIRNSIDRMNANANQLGEQYKQIMGELQKNIVELEAEQKRVGEAKNAEVKLKSKAGKK